MSMPCSFLTIMCQMFLLNWVILCIKFAFFYLSIGQFVFGCLYRIWLDCNCHLKTRFFCLVLFILFIIVSICYFSTYVYPDWMHNGYIVWKSIYSSINFVYVPILSVIGGHILSRVISHILLKRSRRTDNRSASFE